MKKVLLIGGGGTLGTYTALDLIDNDCQVDVIGLGDNPFSDNRITYYQMDASFDRLHDFLEDKHYDGLVDFIWYRKAEDYPAFHQLIAPHTDHHIFLSSYRVYADLEHPIKESSPKLPDVVTDENFLKKEDYAVSKIKCERYLEKSSYDNWTVVRPVISTSQYRFDLVCHSGDMLRKAAQSKEPVRLPASCRYQTAGLDWAGNTGKIIARLLFKKNTFRQCYTVSSGENLTWDTVAGYYTELMGITCEWVTDEEYITESLLPRFGNDWMLRYDRKFNRLIDNRAVLEATGLTKADFLPLKEGIMLEMKKVGL